MQINNLLQMNDWKIEKFLKVILAVQLAMWGVIGLDAIGIQIPILRQFIGFIYLTFVPGILILRILKLHKLGNIETLLYTVGLSIATLMFTGFFMNMLYPFFGISGPISFVPLIVTISVVVLILCVLCYMRDKDFADPGFVDTKMTRKNNTPETVKNIEAGIPLGRLASSRDIADVAYFLCSAENKYITGQNIIVDGGYSIGGFQK